MKKVSIEGLVLPNRQGYTNNFEDYLYDVKAPVWLCDVVDTDSVWTPTDDKQTILQLR